MKWSLNELEAYQNKPLSFQTIMDLKSNLVSRDSVQILDANPINVHAYVFYEKGNAILNTHVKGAIVVPSSRSLVPVNLPLNFSFSEVYTPDNESLKKYEREHKGDTVLTVDKNGCINLDKAVADNIILQIPMHILSKKESADNIMPKGTDWSVISEDEYNHPKTDNKQVDPRLAKLKYFFKNNK